MHSSKLDILAIQYLPSGLEESQWLKEQLYNFRGPSENKVILGFLVLNCKPPRGFVFVFFCRIIFFQAKKLAKFFQELWVIRFKNTQFYEEN